jgi:hypothetical protein
MVRCSAVSLDRVVNCSGNKNHRIVAAAVTAIPIRARRGGAVQKYCSLGPICSAFRAQVSSDKNVI